MHWLVTVPTAALAWLVWEIAGEAVGIAIECMRLAVLPGALLVLIGCSDRHGTPAPQSAGRVETRGQAAPARVTAAPDTAPWTVSETGYGRIMLGMRQSVAQEALGAPRPSGPEAVTEPCAYMEIPDSPLWRAVGVMLVDGVVDRVDVFEPSVATEWGRPGGGYGGRRSRPARWADPGHRPPARRTRGALPHRAAPR